MNLKNVAIHFAVFLLIMNSSTVVISESGLAEDWGVEPVVGGDERIEDANQESQNVTFSGGQGQTLFSLFAGGGRLVESVFSFIFAAPTMFQNAGIPSWATTIFFAPIYLVVFGLIAYTIIGRLL